MTDLISRLSAATGPSRELETEVALANGWTVDPPYTSIATTEFRWKSPNGQICPQPPRYTESIDAAMTSLPKNWAVHTIHGGIINDSGEQRWVVGICLNGNWEHEVEGDHRSSLAVALVSACLKAKEDSKP